MSKIDGRKTYIGGGCAIAVGLATLIYNWTNEIPIDWNFVMGWIIGGWTLISARSAYEKKL